MAKNCEKVAQMMKDQGCTGKKVTKELIESRIESVDYQTVEIAGQKMMFCGIRMDNGFVAVGKPATCIDPVNWRDSIGQEISFNNSFDELWKLEAYRMMSTTPEHIARIAHEVNRAYCRSIGDESQPNWENAPDWQKDSALNGVKIHLLSELTPEQSHISWLKQKESEGWKYGPVKDVEKKEHPCFLPYSELELEQRTKDYLFKAVVDSFK